MAIGSNSPVHTAHHTGMRPASWNQPVTNCRIAEQTERCRYSSPSSKTNNQTSALVYYWKSRSHLVLTAKTYCREKYSFGMARLFDPQPTMPLVANLFLGLPPHRKSARCGLCLRIRSAGGRGADLQLHQCVGECADLIDPHAHDIARLQDLFARHAYARRRSRKNQVSRMNCEPRGKLGDLLSEREDHFAGMRIVL